MKKVLIALDYAPSAEKIAEQGYILAKAMKADVILAHVTADATYYASMVYSPVMGFTGFTDPRIPEKVTAELEKESQRFLDEAKRHLDDDSIVTLVLAGNTADAILEAAASHDADLIVLGTHSRRGLSKLLMGSVAERVLHHSTVPLLIIPTREDKK